MTRKPKDTKPKPFILVLMPFAPTFDDIYKLGIKAACEDAGAYCERTDEQIYTENILDRIYNQIAKADLIVADMSERNPNVFYEVGYAHALGKRTILLTKESGDIPFDLVHYPHIIYGGRIADLKDQLKRKVTWFLRQPSEPFVDVSAALEFYASNQRILAGATVVAPPGNCRGDRKHLWWYSDLLVHNPGKTTVDARHHDVTLLVPSPFSFYGHERGLAIHLPDGTWAVKCFDLDYLLPEAWLSKRIEFYASKSETAWPPSDVPFILRIIGPTGPTDVPFTCAFAHLTLSD